MHPTDFFCHPLLGRVAEATLADTVIGQVQRLPRQKGFKARFWTCRQGVWQTILVTDNRQHPGDLRYPEDYRQLLHRIYAATGANELPEGQPITPELWLTFAQQPLSVLIPFVRQADPQQKRFVAEHNHAT